MRLFILIPVLPLLAYLLLSVFNFHFGLTVFGEIKTWTTVFVLFCGVISTLCFVGGLKTRGRASGFKPKIKTLERVVFFGFLSVSVGLLLQIVDRYMGGLSIKTSLEATSEVRSMRQTTFLSTASVLFLFMYLPAMGSLAYMVFNKIKVRWLLWAVFLIAGGLVVFNSLINVNRAPILNFLFLGAFVLLFGSRVSLSTTHVKRMLWATLAGVTLVIAFTMYSIFISENRTGLSETVQLRTAFERARYDYLAQNLPVGALNFLNSASYYLSHQMIFVDAALNKSNAFRFTPQILNSWFVGQLAPIFPQFYYGYLYAITEVYSIAGVPVYTWRSIIGQLIVGFGWIATPFLLGVLCFFLGCCVRRVIATGDFFAFLLVLGLYYIGVNAYMVFKVDQFINGMIFFMLFLFFLRRQKLFRMSI